jgi:23S rRNA pseudouridine1911/1915/1917 synthase
LKNLKIKALKVDEGKRIDVFLSENITDLTRSKIQRLIKEDKISVNGSTVSKSYRLSEDDIVSIEDYSKQIQEDSELLAQDISIRVVYEDDYLVVISKDASIVTHPACGNRQGTLANALLYHFQNKNKTLSRAGIIHRLDKDTSGLIVAAKDAFAQAEMSRQFKERKITKEYTALVYGTFREKKGTINMPIARSRTDRKKMAVMYDSNREAITEFEIVKEFEKCALVRVSPKTGRTHQIRVHLSYIGHPIIGDDVYGNKSSHEIASKLKLKRHFLHATRLAFFHPVLKKEIDLSDALAEDLQSALKEIGQSS